ncbi:RHS repeat-associated core domain-containing protein, partial [Pseudomonas putida]|nr:RHS repeat-associated core domain-containing protein [Pseudomonas putida]
ADGGTRTRKVHTVQVSTAMQTTITTYAGGCEVRQRWLAGKSDPQKHIVITEGSGIRVVEDRLTGTVHLRYGFADHLGSVGGETDELGKLISREEYAPYGGTVGRDEAAEEVSNLTQRTMRYSGKEQDATGLYYYGWRYYQPELGRWLSADPGGVVDGINLYQFTRGNTISLLDTDGQGSGQSAIRGKKSSGLQQTPDPSPVQDQGILPYKKNINMQRNLRADGAKGLARGIQELQRKKPDDYDRFVRSLHAAVSILDGAIEYIESNPVSYTGLSREALEKNMKAIQGDLVKRLPGGVFSEYVAFFGAQDNSAMRVSTDPTDHNIYVNVFAMRAVDEVIVASDFIHEVSHLLLDTDDYVYIPGLMDATDVPMLPSVYEALNISARTPHDIVMALDGYIAMQVGPGVTESDVIGGQMEEYLEGIKDAYDEPYLVSYVEDLVANNADTYPLLAIIFNDCRKRQVSSMKS